MNYEGYYLVFFIFIGLLIVIYYYNLQQQAKASQQLAQHAYRQRSDQVLEGNNKNRMNTNEDHLKIYNDYSKYKKTNNTDNKNTYTYNIDNIDILNDNPNVNNNTLGSPSNDNCDPELEEVYNTTLRGDKNHTNKPDEVYDYSIKPNKSDLPIVNPPLQLLKNNAPLRLSERHFL